MTLCLLSWQVAIAQPFDPCHDFATHAVCVLHLLCWCWYRTPLQVRAIVRALELGVRVLMLDMDVIVYELARNFTHLAQFDLVYTSFYSFTYTYSAPSSTVLALWRLVLDMVLCARTQ